MLVKGSWCICRSTWLYTNGLSPVPQFPHFWVGGGNIPLLHKPLCIWEVVQGPLVLETLQNPDYLIQEHLICISKLFINNHCLLITTVTAIQYCPQQFLWFSTNDANPLQNSSLNPSARLLALVTRVLTISAFNSSSTD